MMNTIIERIKLIADNEGVKITNFEKSIGASKGVLSRSLSKKTDIQSKWITQVIENYPQYNSEWLLTGKGEMLKTENGIVKPEKDNMPTIIEINPESKSNTILADVKASAGFGEIMNNPKRIENLPAISLPNAPYGLNVGFQVSGDSMYPTIRHLDHVAGNQLLDMNQFRDGYVYIMIDKVEGALCKRIYREGENFKIVSDNPNYPSYIREKEYILGFFKAFCRLSFDLSPFHDEMRNAIRDLQEDVFQIKMRLNTK